MGSGKFLLCGGVGFRDVACVLDAVEALAGKWHAAMPAKRALAVVLVAGIAGVELTGDVYHGT